MIYLYAFLFSGTICALAEVILEFTDLTPLHINTGLVILGAFLSLIGVYDLLISVTGAGASVLITNFGHLLFKGAYEGFLNNGILGALNNIFKYSSASLVSTILFSFLVSAFFKPKH